jgi:hypothetical protein
MPHIKTVFSAPDREGLLRGMIEELDSDHPLRIDEAILMSDEDGNFCQGAVREIWDNGLVLIRADWDTWIDASAARSEAVRRARAAS